MHFPAKIGGRAIEHIVDHFRDLGVPLERAIEHVVINAVFGEQFRERLSIMPFDGVAEGAEQCGGVHRRLPDLLSSCPARRGIRYSRGLETNRWAAAYRIARSRLREGFDGHACQAAEAL